MNLWVRSQDKHNLVKVNNLSISYDFDCYVIKEHEYSTELAYYETQERAFEVLDNIQNKIAQNQSLISLIQNLNFTDLKDDDEEKISKLFKDMIYEMPEE